jgi:hypothetical protein
MGSQVDLSACGSLRGFYISGFMGKASNAPATYVCNGLDATYPNRTAYGCGGQGRGMAIMTCNGFTEALVPGDSFWSSPQDAVTIDQSTDTSSSDGALCCLATPIG